MHTIDGICCHTPDKSDIFRLKQCQFKWARIDINWFDIESSQGKFNWSDIDNAVSQCKGSGINVYASISYTPSWMASRLNSPPDGKEYRRFCFQVAERYNNKIDVYSIWNEPNFTRYFDGDASEFIKKCLIPGYEGIKSVNSNFLVAAPELAMNDSSWYSWCNKLKSYNDYFDIFSIHDYPSSVGEFKKLYQKGQHGKFIQIFFRKYRPYKSILKKMNRPIWLTEIGWNTKTYTYEEQYKKIVTLSNEFHEIGPERVFLYCLKDAAANLEPPWGIYTQNGSGKQVVPFLAFK